jgi:hypothetical protein
MNNCKFDRRTEAQPSPLPPFVKLANRAGYVNAENTEVDRQDLMKQAYLCVDALRISRSAKTI